MTAKQEYRDVAQALTDRITLMIELHRQVPWKREWDPSKCAGPQAPVNAFTHDLYHGVNALSFGLDHRAIITEFGPPWCHDRIMSSLFTHLPHPYIEERRAHAPVKVADQLAHDNRARRVNSWLALKITGAVGTMWCAYAFAVLALISLPDAIKAGRPAIISWIAQTFLQLVLLSIIIVGQNILSAASDKRSEATYKDAEALLHGQEQVAAHMAAQDMVLRAIAAKLAIDVEC